jgi:hypothetical protein
LKDSRSIHSLYSYPHQIESNQIKIEGTTSSATATPPYAAKFYDCCGAEDPDAPGCATDFHRSYDDHHHHQDW